MVFLLFMHIHLFMFSLILVFPSFALYCMTTTLLLLVSLFSVIISPCIAGSLYFWILCSDSVSWKMVNTWFCINELTVSWGCALCVYFLLLSHMDILVEYKNLKSKTFYSSRLKVLLNPSIMWSQDQKPVHLSGKEIECCVFIDPGNLSLSLD